MINQIFYYGEKLIDVIVGLVLNITQNTNKNQDNYLFLVTVVTIRQSLRL